MIHTNDVIVVQNKSFRLIAFTIMTYIYITKSGFCFGVLCERSKCNNTTTA